MSTTKKKTKHNAKSNNATAPEQRESSNADHPQSLELTASAEINVEASVAAVDVESQAAEGSLPRFRMVAYTGSPMRIGAWRYPVVVDLAGLSIPSQARPIRFGHDASAGIGHTDSIRIDENGQLVATGFISRDTVAAREVVVSSKNGFPWQASIGASVDEFEFVRENQRASVNGREYTGPINIVRKSTLGEISFVDLGADGRTSVSVAATADKADAASEDNQENTVMDDDEKVTTRQNGDQSGSNANTSQSQSAPSTGTSQSVAGTDAASTATASANGSASADGNGQSVVEDMRVQAAAEIDRIHAIRRICAGKHPTVESQAIRDGWDATRCELEVLRANRPKAPAVHVADNSTNTQVLEAACLLTAGLDKVDEIFEPKTLDVATKKFRGGIGLQELLLEAAWANGYSGRNFRDSRDVLKYAFRPDLAAAFSVIDIGGILSNVANKFLLDGFFSVERTWRNITAVRNVSDFKTVTSYRLVGKDQYELVAPGGELKHGTLGEESYTNKADTYGLLLSIDRRDIINDDLGAITTVPRKLGRGSGLKINDVFWATYMNNGSFFTAGNNNYISGADTSLSIDGLTKAEVTFMDQVDSDGKPIGIMPSILLVPTALSAVGTQLYKSLELRDTTASTKYPVSNPHQGKFRTEVSRYLSNAQYTGNSAKAWYLLADPGDLPVIEVAFLNGQESPTIETAEADFNVLGVQMRGYHDFGVNLQDQRGGVKSKGEA